jgi:hypothetical protein
MKISEFQDFAADDSGIMPKGACLIYINALAKVLRNLYRKYSVSFFCSF